MKKRSKQTKPEASDGASASGKSSKPSPQDESASGPAHTPGEFPVVGIGASAGGLEAIEAFLDALPADTGMAFIIVTHQHPGHKSMLSEILSRDTQMSVTEAIDGVKVQPNHVYVATPGAHLSMLNRTLQRMAQNEEQAPKLPIDHFFRSLAEDQNERAIGIILSGTGTDGTLGLKAIKAESGMAMVQEPDSAKYMGMPASAIATGLADYVLPPTEMPAKLVAYVSGPYLAGDRDTEPSPAIALEPMQKVFLLLRDRTGHDFSGYKTNTIRRRIERRMNVHQINRPDQYVRYLRDNPHEIDVLFKELLISVTRFFRDPQAWDALRGPLEELVLSRPERSGLRVWVPGCATGEEVYSIAILISECMEKAKRRLEVQIFGTDLDAVAIETARTGRYPDGIAVDVSPERLKRYFAHDENAYRVRKQIREMAIFAPQNVIKDPPFTKLDLLCCRNLLIYLDAGLQKKLLPTFHYALRPQGLLFMGPSETVGSFGDLFTPLDKRWKVFRREHSAAVPLTLPEISVHPARRTDAQVKPTEEEPTMRSVQVSTLIERSLLGRFAPTSVAVNERGDIVYIHGRSGAYLEPAEGQPRNNILEMAREGLEIELRTALRECFHKDIEVKRHGVRIRGNGQPVYVDLTVTKIHEPEPIRGLLLVTFQPTAPAVSESEEAQRQPEHARQESRVEQLERELRYMKESHQTTLEELETTNEELKSTNEELQSTNEEMQSTNEELETSKEELQSLNEELTTVNAELQTKVDDLSHANDDMQNLLNGTDIATVFLDEDLNIKRFTERVKELFMLRETDVGRPIYELASNLKIVDLVGDCRQVLKTLVSKEVEITANNGGSYLMRILPYRTGENVIDGLVLTFIDITRIKAGETATAYFLSIVDTVREPLVVLDTGLHVVSANRAYYQTFHATPEQTQGERVYELGGGKWNIPKLRERLENVVKKDMGFEDYEVELDLPKLGKRKFLLNARRLEQAKGLPDRVLLAIVEK